MSKFIKVFDDTIFETTGFVIHKDDNNSDENEWYISIKNKSNFIRRKSFITKEERDAEFEKIEKLLIPNINSYSGMCQPTMGVMLLKDDE